MNVVVRACIRGSILDFQELEITKWIGLDTKLVSTTLKNLSIDTKEEVVLGEGEDLSHSQPDEEEYTSAIADDEENIYTFASAYDQIPLMEYWYHRFMLVAWPKAMPMHNYSL